MSTKDYLRFQQNLKKSALGIRFGKTLLTDPKSLSTKQITGVLQAMGLQIPKDVQVAADAAQALVTGAAVINQVQAGADIASIIKPGAASLGTLSRIGNEAGLIDDKSATQLAVAGDLCLIFASGGADVGAWIRVGMAVMAEVAKVDAEASQKAMLEAYGKMAKETKADTDQFLDNLKELQEGKLGIFSFLVESAVDCPLVFDNVVSNNPAFAAIAEKFPGLKLFPKTSYWWQGRGGGTTWYGENREKIETVTIQGLQRMTEGDAANHLIRTTIGPAMSFYENLRSYYLSKGKIDPFKLAPLALFQEGFRMGANSNLIEKLIKLQISPYDLGERNTFAGANQIKQSYSVISSFGLTKTEVYMSDAEMDYYDRMGNLRPLLKDKYAALAINKKLNLDIPVDVTDAPSAFAFDDFANFIAIMDFADMIKADPKFNQLAGVSSWANSLNWVPAIEEFKWNYQRVYELSMARRVNGAALLNVANMLGTTPSKLNYKVIEGQPTIFK